MDTVSNMWKVPMKKGTKDMFLCKWKNEKTWRKSINLDKLNGAIITGSANDLIVLDVDVKKKKEEKIEGVQEFLKYIEQYGDVNTFTVKSPSGGFHYYFKYKHSSERAKYLIENIVKTNTGYRNAGLDIRSNGGVIIMPGSSTNLGNYTVLNDSNIIQMPLTLLEWLIEVQISVERQKPKITYIPSKSQQKEFQYVFYDITDKKVEQVLKALPSKYLDNYIDWLKVTTILKRHDMKDLWEKWSKNSKIYNRNKNLNIWENIGANFDINLLVSELRDLGTDVQYFNRYKPYHPITKDISNITKFEMNHKYLYDKDFKKTTFSYELFSNYNTIILEGCTGTGKTTAVATHIKKYMQQHKNKKCLTITTKTTLSDQHVISFQNICMKHYKHFKGNLYDADSLSICLNSLYKLDGFSNDELDDYVVYIDEIKPFLELTHNKTLDSRMKELISILVKFIKNANKVLVSDAMIDDNVFEFLKYREQDKMIFVRNSFKKYEGVEAVRLRNENEFRDTLLKHCQVDQPFLFGCDSKDSVSSLYHYCKNNTDELLHDRFLLITDEYTKPLENINELFRNKFVFYSPNNTFGIDFSIQEKQDVFIYIRGGSIQPHGMFQQATRCRNIDKLYYYGEVIEQHIHFHNLDEVKRDVKLGASMTEELINGCTYINEVDEIVFIENMFFNLFCYNEYVYDIYKTNKVKHFELLLEENGFKLSVVGDRNMKINKK